MDMFKFILGEKDLKGSVIEKRINETISTGKNFLYKPRSAGGGFNKHHDKVDKASFQRMQKQLEFYLHFFGYAKDERTAEQIKNKKADSFNSYEPLTFDFYDYEGKAKPENKAAFMDF